MSAIDISNRLIYSRQSESAINSFVITDDFAADQGPLINPKDIDKLCTPFYRWAGNKIHEANSYILLHFHISQTVGYFLGRLF